jgi:hypothetical protein
VKVAELRTQAVPAAGGSVAFRATSLAVAPDIRRDLDKFSPALSRRVTLVMEPVMQQ